MKNSNLGQSILNSTSYIISEINELIHINLDQKWFTDEWHKKEGGVSPSDIHPLINTTYLAYQQINQFIKDDTPGMTLEIFELTELAIKINALKRNNIPGLLPRLDKLISSDFSLYRSARYEIQIAGMLLLRGHKVKFIKESNIKNPDILVFHTLGKCEIECKHKEPLEDQLDYVRSIYYNTQAARKQFSKQFPGLIFIEIDKVRFDEFQDEKTRLEQEIIRAMHNSTSISAILLTSKKNLEENNDYVYRHRVAVFPSTNARHPLPTWLANNLVNN